MVDLRYVLILLIVEKDHSAVAVDEGTVKCIFMCFITSENSARDNSDPFRRPASVFKLVISYKHLYSSIHFSVTKSGITFNCVINFLLSTSLV